MATTLVTAASIGETWDNLDHISILDTYEVWSDDDWVILCKMIGHSRLKALRKNMVDIVMLGLLKLSLFRHQLISSMWIKKHEI